MSDIERHKAELRKTIISYNSSDITLNKAIQRMEAILCLDSMNDVKNKVWDDLSVLEEFNAYLLDGGERSEEICKKIESLLLNIEDQINRHPS